MVQVARSPRVYDVCIVGSGAAGGTAAKILAAYDAGCRRFDSAIGGLGGCPFAQDDLVGNIPTEVVIETLQKAGAQLPSLKSLDALLRATAEIGARYKNATAE